MIEILQTPSFSRDIKKLHSNQKKDLDFAIRKIADQPDIGQLKKGDLAGTRVYKFQMVNQLTLLAYRVIGNNVQLILLAVGLHENFYRDLKK